MAFTEQEIAERLSQAVEQNEQAYINEIINTCTELINSFQSMLNLYNNLDAQITLTNDFSAMGISNILGKISQNRQITKKKQQDLSNLEDVLTELSKAQFLEQDLVTLLRSNKHFSYSIYLELESNNFKTIQRHVVHTPFEMYQISTKGNSKYTGYSLLNVAEKELKQKYQKFQNSQKNYNTAIEKHLNTFLSIADRMNFKGKKKMRSFQIEGFENELQIEHLQMHSASNFIQNSEEWYVNDMWWNDKASEINNHILTRKMVNEYIKPDNVPHWHGGDIGSVQVKSGDDYFVLHASKTALNALSATVGLAVEIKAHLQSQSRKNNTFEIINKDLKDLFTMAGNFGDIKTLSDQVTQDCINKVMSALKT